MYQVPRGEGDIWARASPSEGTFGVGPGSMVGSLEFCTGKLGSRMILVVGHTKCGAVYGAANAYLEAWSG